MVLGPRLDALSTLPAELHLQIYSSACLDDGFTGRSLSRVSKLIREYSKVHRYNSVALSNDIQIAAFRNILDSEDDRPVVKHLYILSGPKQSTFTAWKLFSMMTSVITGPAPRLHYDQSDIIQIFEYVSHSLETLSACGMYGGRALSHTLAVQSFPRLVELTLWSPSFAPVPPRNAPLLQLLHISGDVSPALGAEAPAPAEDYPNLRRFRISQYTGSPGQGQLVSALGRFIFAASMDNDDDRGCFLIEALAKTRAEAEHFQQDFANVNSATTEACVVDCISILPSLLPGDPKLDARAIKQQWLSRLENGLGCWTVLDSPSLRFEEGKGRA